MRPAVLIAIRLAKAGLGTVDVILKQPVRLVLSQWTYVKFATDYDETFHQLNKPEGIG